MNQPGKNPPLAGVRVLDLTRLLPGPFATCLLADLGADVLKVEDPLQGDYLRLIPPLVTDTSAAFLVLNRNKRGLVLDLKTEAGREVFLKLIESYDVLVDGFRPDVLPALGLDEKTLRERVPRLIHATLSGYAAGTDRARRAGHDLNYQALGGSLSLSGAADGAPAMPGLPIADLAGALYFANAVLAAVIRRERTGEGARIEVPLADVPVALSAYFLAEYGQSELEPAPRNLMLNGRYVCYQLYRTADDRWMSLAALEPKFWAAFCAAVDKPHLLAEAYAPADNDHPVKRELDELFASKTQVAWIDLLRAHDCCCEPVHSLAEAARDPYFHGRGAIAARNHPGEGEILETKPPIRFADGGNEREIRPAPARGEHTDEVLAGLGCSADEVAAWRRRGAFGTGK